MIELQIGQVYTNRNGAQYKVIGTTIAGTIMQRISDNWTLVAHGIVQYPLSGIFLPMAIGPRGICHGDFRRPGRHCLANLPGRFCHRHHPYIPQPRREVSGMNYESIRELRTVRSEDEINALLASRKWRIISMDYEDGVLVARMAKVRE